MDWIALDTEKIHRQENTYEEILVRCSKME